MGAGVQSSVRFVEALREHFEVTVITTGEPGEGLITFPAWYFPFYKKTMVENGFACGWASPKKLREVLRGFDLLHMQYAFPLGFAAKRAAEKR